MPILDAIPVNIFIVSTTLLTGIILFFVLTQIPDDEVGSKTERK